VGRRVLPDLSGLSARELLGLHAKVSAELRKQGICRSGNNPVADYAEMLVSKALGLTLAPGSTTGFDATDSRGRCYEIKARRTTALSNPTMLSAIRGLEKRHFAFLVAVIFQEDYSVQRAVLLPHSSVVKIARHRTHVNAHIVMLADMWRVAGGRDITEQVATASTL
jgi:hypothetical protein